MGVTSQDNAREIEEVFAAEFGVNASYVADLFQQFSRDPQSIDEEWREFFDELISSADGRALAPHAEAAKRAAQSLPARSVDNEPPGQPSETVSAAPASANRIPLTGPALKIAQNMEASLSIPTATSIRQVPVRLLEENRLLINNYLRRTGRKISYTHLIARAIVRSLAEFPQLNAAFLQDDGVRVRQAYAQVNLGLAVDVVRKDGSRALLVPNVKDAGSLTFPELVQAYDDVVRRAREGKLLISDFQNTSITLTNPGTLGTTASSPRLMPGQGAIIATGAIDYSPEYQAMSRESLSWFGISKIMTISSTYDHRIIQGAESGGFLALIDEMLKGQHDFYDALFAELGIPFRPYRWAVDRNPALLGEQRYAEEVRKQSRVLELINAYRVRGHLIANINPLGFKEVQYHPELDIHTYGLTIWDLDREFITGGLGGTEIATLRQIVEWLRQFYCGRFGVEYRNIQSPSEKEWIRSRVETEQPVPSPEEKKQMLWKLISAEQFEKFLGSKYLGQKRFSIEGNETVVAILDQLIELASARGVDDITIGMSHRGRLNVIANVIGRFCERIFASFEGSVHPKFPHDMGDVKYHQGAAGTRETAAGAVNLTVPPNPSHLEFVGPVVEGMVRARQDLARHDRAFVPDTHGDGKALAVLLHGDAAFAGEGVVAETLNLSGLEGYTTQGTIHIIVNNQLGFTTPPESGRTSVYSTDVAKMIQVPIFHVNGDAPDAAFAVLQIALDYRQQFHKDVVIDIIGFRRHGHNEGDEPTYTQPLMYRRVRAHPGVRELYSRRLVAQGLLDEQAVASLMEERMRRYENALLGARAIVAKNGERPQILADDAGRDPLADTFEALDTGVSLSTLRQVASAVTAVPRGFNLNPKITSLLARRAKMVDGDGFVDFGMAESLAFGSLLLDGVPVRLTGQDTVRGTFSHRHDTFYDMQSNAVWTPLETLGSDQARFEVYDSPLCEAGALGFEYGYSVAASDGLVLWEAQFGDFINAAQVIVDQFIVSGEEKWDQKTRMVLLLPHGLEGQGPEHSSSRVERFLQLAAGGNIRIANCTTAAQYFHVLRRQALLPVMKPLVLLTPKSLLRVPRAGSPIDEFTSGGFRGVIGDDLADRGRVRRVLLCSGKVYYDLDSAREESDDGRTALLRVEQLYPFPADLLASELAAYANAAVIRWVQEEPANMGAWSFVQPRLRVLLNPGQELSYAGRPPSSSPATGSHTVHQMEQEVLVKDAFADQSNESAVISAGIQQSSGA